jgi:hypothetical protein
LTPYWSTELWYWQGNTNAPLTNTFTLPQRPAASVQHGQAGTGEPGGPDPKPGTGFSNAAGR